MRTLKTQGGERVLPVLPRSGVIVVWLLSVVLSLLVVPPAMASGAPELHGDVSVAGRGVRSAEVRVVNAFIPREIKVDLSTTADYIGVFLVEKNATRSTPWTAGWMKVSADALCEGLDKCDRGLIEDTAPMDATPDGSDALPVGSYSLVVVTDPPASFNVTLSMPGTGAMAVATATTDAVQVARLKDQDPVGTDHLWWAGAERQVKDNALLATVAALAGPVKGPGEFNYCVYNGEPALTKLGRGDLTYATCADGVVVGGRSVGAQSNYATVLRGLGFPGKTGTAGQGAHYLGAIDIQNALAVSVWIDP